MEETGFSSESWASFRTEFEVQRDRYAAWCAESRDRGESEQAHEDYRRMLDAAHMMSVCEQHDGQGDGSFND